MKTVDPPGPRALAFFGGGTAGHLFPGIALAERARERFPGCRAVFFRTSRTIEERVFGGRGLETRLLDLHAPGRRVAGWLRYSLEAARAKAAIQRILSGGAFDAAFGLGGYASFPGILAARAAGLPVILLEQNRVPGKVNRLLAPFADLVACSFEGTPFRFGARAEVTGNPLRKEVLEAARARPARRRGSAGKRTVLVVGGSQGAGGVNRGIRLALPALQDLRGEIQWIHAAGDADKDAMTEAYRIGGWKAEVIAYSPRLPDLMAASDLVIGRAGGTTLSELAAIGVASVLVPYPHHADRHQLENAMRFVEGGAARLLSEAELGAASLRGIFEEVLFRPDRLEDMEMRALGLARPGAADLVLDLVTGLWGERPCPRASASSS